MTKIIQWINDLTGFSNNTIEKLLNSIAIILFLWIVRLIVIKIVRKKVSDLQTRYKWQKNSVYFTVFFGILLISRVWFQGIQYFTTYFGLLSAGLAIALKDVIESMVGWAFILWRNLFTVGDRIQIGDYKGDIVDIRLFKFTILEIGNWVDADQSTGRLMDIPNNMIFTHVLANYSKGFEFIWNEIPILVTFESDWKKAKSILNEIVNKKVDHLSASAEEKIKSANKKFLISYQKFSPTVYTSIKDSGVMLTLRYLIEPRKRRNSEQSIMEEILSEFSKYDNIDFAYPTRRIYNNLSEAKNLNKP
ncbi:MAG: mechanosensitive ion channel protein MscS [Ignavibacteriales bacterium CG_4_9_14_3_um_filter_30_11]|nr:MAG: mechanosensitive ion channel protein MscS [Ignavibacteriales bacterium CG_4_9_14_3_um_filter_30_11]